MCRSEQPSHQSGLNQAEPFPAVPDEHGITRSGESAAESSLLTRRAKEQKRGQSTAAKLLIIVKYALFCGFAFSLALVLCWRWIPPPTSSVMILKRIERLFQRKHRSAIRYRWVDWEKISPQMSLAVVAAEDQNFPEHYGFDFEAIQEAMEKNRKGRRLRGAIRSIVSVCPGS